MTGTGTEVNPYIVHSTRGFLWLSNNSLSKISLNSKYLELACDIVLNDETFDKDGNPSGGDGVVFAWEPISKATGLIFDGGDNCISGLYYNNPTAYSAGVFGDATVQTVKNLKMKSVCITNCLNFGSVGRRVKYVDNVDVLSGSLFGVNGVGGIVGYSNKVVNCNNYANLICLESETYWRGSFGGIVVNSIDGSLVIENCNNYGNLQIHSNAGGIVAYLSNTYNTSIKNCYNYGTIKFSSYQIGGIVGALPNKNSVAIIERCYNFGKIIRETGGTIENAGGIIGRNSYGTLVIKQCQNGDNFSENQNIGYFIGAVSNLSVSNIIECDITQKNCLVSSVSGDATNCFVNIKQCRVKIFEDMLATRLVSGGITLQLENVEIDSYGNCKYNLFNNGKASSIAILKNVLYKNCSVGICEWSHQDSLVSVSRNGVVENSASKKQFYGNDFSGFYVDFKTGKFGVKSLSGKGFYQGKVSEEYLLNKGFSKKS